MDSTIFNPNVPFNNALPYPLQAGHIIRISGTSGTAASCFSINLQSGSNGGQRGDIALHLSPVFSAPPRMVRNSLERQSWGPEESHGAYFPFVQGQDFEILILVEADHFKIAVNGQHFTEFQYRLPLHVISHIAADGDVAISTIKFEGLAKSPMHSPLPPSGRPASPYDTSPTLPYPTSFGPSPTTPYAPPPSNPYGPPQQQHGGGYAPSPSYGPPSPSGGGGYPYGPPPTGGSTYPHQSGAYPQQSGGYPQQSGGYPQQSGGYPQQSGGYPSSHQYPTQPGPYPGTSVVYPGQEKTSSGSGMNFGPIAAAGAAALAGLAGSAVMGGKHKKNKHGHGGMMGGLGPASLIGGVGSLLGGTKKSKSHGHSGGGLPIGGAMAGGAAALAGAYMLSKSPMGKVMKPKKMFKHKHKSGGWGGFGSSSSSSSD